MLLQIKWHSTLWSHFINIVHKLAMFSLRERIEFENMKVKKFDLISPSSNSFELSWSIDLLTRRRDFKTQLM